MTAVLDASLRRRIGFAIVAIPLAIVTVWFGGWPLALVVATTAVLGAREVYDLSSRVGINALPAVGFPAAACIALGVHLALARGPAADMLAASWPFLVAGYMMLLMAGALLARTPGERPLEAIAVTLFGVIYAGLLPTFLLVIRGIRWPERSWSGTALVLFPLVVTWVGDTAAMFGGQFFGRTRLAPTVSPGKTRAGGVAGLLGSLAMAPIFVYWIFPAAGVRLSIVPACVMALVLGVAAQLGDLAESLLKREAGVKDSSALIPGHGGVLDRLDSLYFVLPAAAACYRLLGLA
jgi:phosphatidate cytidylyltransferase